MPNWRAKAALVSVLSALPAGHRLNYMLQRHVTHSLPRSADAFAETIATAQEHLDAYRRYGGDSTPLTTFEFGAGWDMAGPLARAAAGARHQIVVDIRPLARPELIRDAIRRLGLSEPTGSTAVELLDGFGIRYLAPCDAGATGLPGSSIDLVTSTSTLEHIPPNDIRAILRECRRILRPDGIVSCRINYEDHYKLFDGQIGRYHYLRYSAARWRWYNPSLHYQNRLRHRDYLGLFEEAGFALLEDRHEAPDPGRLSGVHREFAGYSAEELAIPRALLVYRRRA